GADVPRHDATGCRHAVRARTRGTPGVLDEEHPDRARHPLLRCAAQARVAAARRAAVFGGQRMPRLSERSAGALRTGTQCRRGGKTGAARRHRIAIVAGLAGCAVARRRARLAPDDRAAQSCAMHARFELPDWNALAALDDAELPLLGTALLIAR